MSNVVTNSSIRKDILHIAFPVLFIQLAVFGRIFIATYVISQVNAHATAAFAATCLRRNSWCNKIVI